MLLLTLAAARGRAEASTPPPGLLERATAMIDARAFDQAADLLRRVLSDDPANRRAQEMLAFALESSGDIADERSVRAALAAEFPDDARMQADYGRVLERSGENAGALAAYRRARELAPGLPGAHLDEAIERTRGRSSVESALPVSTLSDPDATAARVQAGAAVPLGAHAHLALVAARATAEDAHGAGETTGDQAAASLVLRHRSGASLTAGPRVHAVTRADGEGRDVALGGTLSARAPLGPFFEFDATGELDVPWEDAAVAVLHGGRSSAAQGHLYAHMLDHRLVVQVGGLGRRLSILSADLASTARPEATQSLLVAGADVVAWRKPGAALRGEMLDDSLLAPAALPAALVVSYRHYEVSTRTTPEFASLIDLAPRGSVDEISQTLSLASPRGRFGVALRAGLGRDTDRGARTTMAGGSLVWAPTAALRVALAYEEATDDLTTGLTGRRQAGTLSLHADF